jgi:hypothetical protein
MNDRVETSQRIENLIQFTLIINGSFLTVTVTIDDENNGFQQIK